MNSQIDFLKQIIGIMMGLSLTSAVQTFIAKYLLKPKELNNVKYLIFFLILLNIIRFFYASWMYLDKEISESGDRRNRKYLVHFINVISQSLIFAFLSSITYERFFEIFALILFVDVIGFTLSDKIFENNRHSLEKRWILNNLLSVIGLLVIFLAVKDPNQRTNWCLLISFINTIIGFILSWEYYYRRK